MSWADVNGLRTYYQTHGDGIPVVLLHGAFAGAASWSAQIPALVSAGFEVWCPERRGHAHTPDVPGPLTYAVMAEDTIAFFDTVLGKPAHVVGWSDGAVVGALLAMRRPDLVQRLVLIGQYYDQDGEVHNGIVDLLESMRDNPPDFLRQSYDPFSPDGPEHFPVVYGKTLDMIAAEPRIPLSELARIEAETLVLQGDRDEVTLEHSARVVEAIPRARLAVLPGSHALPLEQPAVVNALLAHFLHNGGPEALWEPPSAADTG